ncbi:recombinase family protein [Bacillus sp. JJ634]
MKVAIYLRRSRDEEGLGIDEVLKVHEHTLVNLCRNNNYAYDVFREIASSSSIGNRPEMVHMLELIKQGMYNAVAVMDIDRLSRNEFDSSDIKRVLHDTGTLIITPYRIYDLQKDDDSLLMGVSSLIASQEYKLIHKRMQRAKTYCKQQGQWVDGIPPLGYDKGKDKKLVPNDRAEDVRFIFNSIVDGRTIPSLIKELERMHIRTRTGSQFHYNAILRIVNNEVYKGCLHGLKDTHEAIVIADVWNKANTIVNEYSFKAPRSKNRVYPTTGLIYCGNCGKVQGCNYHPHIDKYYVKVCKCGNRTYYYNDVLTLIKADVLSHKETLLNSILELENNTESNNTTTYRTEQLQKAIQKVEIALDKIEILFEEDEITLPQYRERKTKRQAELESLHAELEAIPNTEAVKQSLEEQLAAIDTLVGKWQFLDGEGLSDEVVNRVLHVLIRGIVWRYDKGRTTPVLRIVYK